MYIHVIYTQSLTLASSTGLPHVELHVLTDVGEEVVVGVQVRDDLIAIVELALTMVAVDIVHWRLEEEMKGGGGGRGRGEEEGVG